MASVLVALFALAAAAAAFEGEAGKQPPHIVFLFADNVGWANVGFHRPPDLPAREIHTPNLDELARTGIILDRHYTYKFCSPSRSSVLTGRLPIHVNVYNDDPMMPGAGVPLGMTMIPAKLAEAGYKSHMLGKWHVGMATPAHTPIGRGFDSSLHYFDSGNNYYNQTTWTSCSSKKYPKGEAFVDLWDTDHRAADLNSTDYEELLFAHRALDIIDKHPVTSPLFLYWALHTSCTGQTPSQDEILQPLPRMNEKFSFINDTDRRANAAMVALMDEAVGNVTQALKARGMWSNTLLLWSSDNGGAVHLKGGANSYPLKGGYLTNFEGGIRAAALLNGGFLPSHVRGSKLEGFIHEADWYATFCHLAGLDPTDHAAASASLPPIDSLNMWPLITGTNSTSPRFEWAMTPMHVDLIRDDMGSDAGYMLGGFKLLVGKVWQNGWCGQLHPNTTKPWDTWGPGQFQRCKYEKHKKKHRGCLYDVINDPEERHDLAHEMPEKAEEIYAKMEEAQKTWYNPKRGFEGSERKPDHKACAVTKSTGFLGPWLNTSFALVI